MLSALIQLERRMNVNGPQLSELMGELIAYRVALLTVIGEHPHADQLHDRLRTAGETGAAVLLGDWHPDEALAAYERAMGAIVALLPAPL